MRQLSRQPKTIDAYARNLDTYLATFQGESADRWIDADEAAILTYLDDLRSGRQVRSRRVPPEKVLTLSGTRVADYDRHRALLTIRAETSKSGIDRWVPLSPFSQQVLNHYLDRHRQVLAHTYDLDERGALFVSESTRNPGQPLAPGAFNDVIAAMRTTLDLPQLHPHTLRHQRLTALKAAGVPLEDIALFAGHASTETTRLYLHLAPTEVGRKIREATRGVDAYLESLVREAVDGT